MCGCIYLQVLCVAHSSVSVDGRQGQGGEDKSYWVVLVKDLEQKGYFLRIVDKEVGMRSRCIIKQRSRCIIVEVEK